MQAAASSHRYASQLTSIGVGQSGNPIREVVRSEITKDRPESGRERVLRCLNGVLCLRSPPPDGC